MWKEYNPSPVGRKTGDCAVRAVAKAIDTDWETAYALLAMNGFAMGMMPNEPAVFSATLRKNGFYRKAIPNTCPDCYTIEDFAKDNPDGVFVLATGTPAWSFSGLSTRLTDANPWHPHTDNKKRPRGF